MIVNGEQSDPAEITSDVPQGTTVQALFYFNDFTDHITSSVRLHADDVILYITIQSEKKIVATSSRIYTH